jgi:hypothetical protein
MRLPKDGMMVEKYCVSSLKLWDFKRCLVEGDLKRDVFT